MGRSRMQKMVILIPTQSKHSETDGHTEVVIVALHCGESALNCEFAVGSQLAMLCVRCVTKI